MGVRSLVVGGIDPAVRLVFSFQLSPGMASAWELA